ncbi:hypothetical protein PF004_g21012 [Phytophthora fragariae]|uniref:RxLR effector protein n=1 Tax=Phytophthora fragariae TaxID=53985 RepID=A0A6G0N490_9STRA|nr:hypothetical protein PF004_g21012 [Phytophthora fragariae]
MTIVIFALLLLAASDFRKLISCCIKVPVDALGHAAFKTVARILRSRNPSPNVNNEDGRNRGHTASTHLYAHFVRKFFITRVWRSWKASQSFVKGMSKMSTGTMPFLHC